ncbi:PDR/VanB family oxidoreductase [Mycolicibacterium sp.]|uniref:PDR/VanB family oxidoreductase n=1 Tax=Mycolicibacterium sp. TaxID=2320850 RepID=UPI003D10ED80
MAVNGCETDTQTAVPLIADGIRGQVAEFKLVVRQVERVAESVVAVTLSDPDGGDLPAWDPGAHISISLPIGVERQYSLCGDPTDHTRWRIAVLEHPAGGGGSRYIHHILAVGDLLCVRGPSNLFVMHDADAYLFLAGGIGITPILPMVRHAHSVGKPWRLVYGGRTSAAMAFLDELDAYGDNVVAWPQDERGLIDLETVIDAVDHGTQIYCCGPVGLIDAVEQRCDELPTGTLHIERFDATVAPPATDEPFEVYLRHSDLVLTVDKDQTIVAALEAAGVGVATSCMKGTCGTCLTDVIDGIPDHRDSVLSESERASNEYMMICCSRALSPRLVLDL